MDNYLNAWHQIVVLSLAISSISMTICKAKIFSSFREHVSKMNTWCGGLVKCPYCLSHWISLLFVVLYRPKIIQKFFLLDYFVTIFVIVSLASFWSLIICKVFVAMDSLGDHK